jgi:hypothetical protein
LTRKKSTNYKKSRINSNDVRADKTLPETHKSVLVVEKESSNEELNPSETPDKVTSIEIEESENTPLHAEEL